MLIVGCNKIEKIDTLETQDTFKMVWQPLPEETAWAFIDECFEEFQSSVVESEEAWKLFDEFWVEFQRAVAEGDEKAIRRMIMLDDTTPSYERYKGCFTTKIFIDCVHYLQDYFKSMNKENNYRFSRKEIFVNVSGTFIEKNVESSIYYKDGIFLIEIIEQPEVYYGYFRIINGRYKLNKFIMRGISNSAYY